MAIGTYHRYCLLKEAYWWRMWEPGLALVWRAKRLALESNPLPVGFTALVKLAALTPAYTTVEDLRGPTAELSADIEELVSAGLSRKEAAAVIAALGELP